MEKLNWHFPNDLDTVPLKKHGVYYLYCDTGVLQFLERFGVDKDDPIVVDAMDRYECEFDCCEIVENDISLDFINPIFSQSAWNLSRALNEILYFTSKKFMDEKLHKFICDLCDFTGSTPQRYFASAWNFVERHNPELFKLKTTQPTE